MASQPRKELQDEVFTGALERLGQNAGGGGEAPCVITGS